MTRDPLFDFTGQRALVTGGSRGLGREMALALARRGASLIIASRKTEACEAVVAEINSLGGQAVAVSAHLGRWADAERLATEAWAAFGGLDILVNNAGMGPYMPSVEVSEALFDSVVNLNFKGPFRLSALMGARMAAGSGGAILNISSIASLKPMPGVVPYAGAKAALNALTVSMAAEFAPKVRVNAIAAGPFLTDIAKAWSEDARQRQHNAAGRPGRPDEIVTAALALLSPASSFQTGSVVRVDGGA